MFKYHISQKIRKNTHVHIIIKPIHFCLTESIRIVIRASFLISLLKKIINSFILTIIVSFPFLFIYNNNTRLISKILLVSIFFLNYT